jgi:hypothetical protein
MPAQPLCGLDISRFGLMALDIGKSLFILTPPHSWGDGRDKPRRSYFDGRAAGFIPAVPQE